MSDSEVDASQVLTIGSSKQPRSEGIENRTDVLFDRRYHQMNANYDRLLMWLILVQWAVAVGLSLWLSPLAWAGKQSAIHSHVFAAVVLGGAITSLPVLLTLRAPGKQSTRYIIAVAQMLWSALLIHLSGGRIETHFHIFASLAILSFYRDAKIMIPATVAVAADHFARGIYWPESIYGIANPEWWRFLEHAGWVVFLDFFLLYSCINLKGELRAVCRQQVELEDAQNATARNEKLAALGQLAAGVGHELRNPLAAVRNAVTFIDKKLHKAGEVDPKVERFIGIIGRELEASNKIISNLLDFSRPKAPTPSPTPIGPLVDEVLSIIPQHDQVELVNEVSPELPVPDIDKDQFRQVLINLTQNGAEAIADGTPGRVVVRAEVSAAQILRIIVSDNGAGMPPEVVECVFQPLFSTKVKGTGLGLAVVASIIERHSGTLTVNSTEGVGTEFIIEVPLSTASKAA